MQLGTDDASHTVALRGFSCFSSSLVSSSKCVSEARETGEMCICYILQMYANKVRVCLRLWEFEQQSNRWQKENRVGQYASVLKGI